MSEKLYLGIDVGSVSTDFAVVDEESRLRKSIYLRTEGKPIKVIKKGLRILGKKYDDANIYGAGTTGSGRNLAGVITGADTVKNEITSHAVAAAMVVPEVRTVIEIGGQDSKIIIINNGVAVDFAMNTVCAAGTGSFLDQQANRLGIPIEKFGSYALKAKSPVRIAGRCSVFAESDMIHKQQMGCEIPEIIAGLCEALVRNYLNNVARGKDIKPPIIFQGGVAANEGIKKAFESELGNQVIIPKNHNVMGAIGAAVLAAEETKGKNTQFKGFKITEKNFRAKSFACQECPNHCEIINIYQDNELIARWGAKCPRWEAV
ncbi:MAG: acyl-CoA dehydratase activase [Halanaerobiales bacterium]